MVMQDYLVTVLPNSSFSSEPVYEERLINRSEDYAEGFVAAIKTIYPEHQVFINPVT